MKKFLLKLFIITLISLTIAAIIELVCFVNDDEFWKSVEEIEYYDHYDRK